MRPVTCCVGMLLALVAWRVAAADMPGAPDADHLADRVQELRNQAHSLWATEQPSAEQLAKAESLLDGAIDVLDQPPTRALAEGSAYLAWRRYDTLRDLAAVYAQEGRRTEALDALEAMQGLAWLPGTRETLLKTDAAAFHGLHDEPRFQAMIATLDAADRLWRGDALATPYRPQLSEAERVAGLSLFWSEARAAFAHFDHVPQLDWNRTYLDFLPRVIAARDTATYYEVLMRFAALLQDGHTGIDPPEALADHFFARPPLRTALVQDRVLVTDVASPMLERQGIRVGDELVRIDGEEVKTYAARRVAPYVSSSTPQDRAVRTYDYELLRGDKAAPVRVTLRDARGGERTVEVSRGDYADLRRPARNIVRELPGHIVYVALDDFESDAPVKAFEQALPKILKARGLILDVRRNGGGSTGYGLEILSYLTRAPVPTERSVSMYVPPVARAHGALRVEWRALPFSAEPYVHPHPQVYEGPVAVLIGPRTFSAGEDVVVSFDAMKRGVLVGEATGGSTGQPLMFRLPGGGLARICVKRDSYPDGREFVGKGIAPQISVAPTAADVRAGRDPVVERAREALLHAGR